MKVRRKYKKINAKIMTKLGKDYEVKFPAVKKPKMRICGVKEEIEEDDLTTALPNQNGDTIKDESKLQMKINKKFKNSILYSLRSGFPNIPQNDDGEEIDGNCFVNDDVNNI